MRAGLGWSAYLWFDIDRADLVAALQDTRRLTHWLTGYSFSDDALLIFFSGSKGFHVGLPTPLLGAEPSAMFNRACRCFAERIAEVVGITIDASVYDKVRPFRAPNSRHPKTGLHKRRLSLDELNGLSIEGIRNLAASPVAFDLPSMQTICQWAKADWSAAVDRVGQEIGAKAKRTANGKPTLNRQTLAFIREGVGVGDRHRLLYSAARNLAEFGCPSLLAHALLEESALDSGLPPKEVHRQIECGLKDERIPPAVEQSPTPSAWGHDLQTQLAALWQLPTPTPIAEPIADNSGDAWEHPHDQLGTEDGPYSKEGGGR